MAREDSTKSENSFVKFCFDETHQTRLHRPKVLVGVIQIEYVGLSYNAQPGRMALRQMDIHCSCIMLQPAVFQVSVLVFLMFSGSTNIIRMLSTLYISAAIVRRVQRGFIN
jgi:hypothetical protein